MKKLFLIRHCEADSQAPEAELTERGREQAKELADRLSNLPIDRILSSPYVRAVESILPLARQQAILVKTDDRLKERILSSAVLPDWLEKLRSTFDDPRLRLEGGESSNEALARIAQVISEWQRANDETILVVTHGNIMSLLIGHYIQDFGFDGWRTLSNPDVYVLIENKGEITCERLWKKGEGK